ncbi:MAG: tryptophan--tRNA ligase [Candidatus Ratteibacteria bacterium]|jgi:tryptophanyl-tRNA synthetase
MNLKENKKRILSGMRPTGPLHIGHLFGALANWKRLQDSGEYHAFYMIADLHALSTEYQNPSQIGKNVFEIALDFFSCGLDPEKSVIFIQSQVPGHAMLYALLSMIVPLGWLERNPVYKEQLHELREKEITTYGFLGYPVLQAADIMLYCADSVPIGVDQVPHLELTREIVRRFHYLYGEFFPEPEALLTTTPKVPGLDNRKMSKSYGNAIFMKDSAEEIRKKVSTMFTDPKRIYKKDPGHPDKCPVFLHHGLVSTEIEDIYTGCRGASLGCVECKKLLAERMISFLAPLRAKREELAGHPKKVRAALEYGRERAMKSANKTVEAVNQLMGLNYETDR